MFAALLGATLGAMLPISAMATSWGAISADEVIGEKNPYWGAGGGGTKDEAEKNAQKFCAEAGGKNCAVLVTYQQCGAYAASNKYSGTGTGATKEIAKVAALKECNNANCSIVTADCNE
jgi:hypothetical protein